MIKTCQLDGQADEADYRYPYGCPIEPADGAAYPDLLAQMLGSPYSDGYKVAEPGDYRTESQLGPPVRSFLRVVA